MTVFGYSKRLKFILTSVIRSDINQLNIYVTLMETHFLHELGIMLYIYFLRIGTV